MHNSSKETRILAIRNDKLGDFMLAWPAFALLKHYWPESHITALVPEYTAPIAKLCPTIDELLIDPQDRNIFALLKLFRNVDFDAMLTLFSTTRIALSGILTKIPYRLAPATKIAQFFYNHRLTQRRSLSLKPEYLYNIELAAQLLIDFKKVPSNFALNTRDHDHLPAEITRPLLKLGNTARSIRETFLKKYDLPNDSKLIFIHPGSGGSAANLSINKFAELAAQMTHQSGKKVSIVICAGPDERDSVKALQAKLSSGTISRIYHSTSGIGQFATTLMAADIFISGSTGTLHVAGALNIPTVGFYPTKRSSTSLRWQTLSSPKRRLEFSLPEKGKVRPGEMFDIRKIAKEIIERL